MKSIVLLFWVLGANGQERVGSPTYFDDLSACASAAERRVAEYAERGIKSRYLCQRVIEEDENVDTDGNPL